MKKRLRVGVAVIANLMWIVALDHVMLVMPAREAPRDAILVSVIEPVLRLLALAGNIADGTNTISAMLRASP